MAQQIELKVEPEVEAPARKQEVAPRQESVPAPPAQSETAAVLSLIERAARDPNIDIDKMERLIVMQRTIKAEAAEKAFNTAMKIAQAEMRPVAADANNPQTKSRYASYAALDRALRPIYTKNGFALSFDEADSPKPEHIRVLCYVTHEDGHTRIYHKDMPADGKGAKGGDVMTKTHATGAAASYGARYLLKGIFNVAVGDDDRDGNTVERIALISQKQADDIRELIEAVGADTKRFLSVGGFERIEDIPAAQYDAAIRMLKAKGQKQGGAR